MMDKHVRMTIEFDIDQEALQKHGLSANDVLKHIHFYEDLERGGFGLLADLPGFSSKREKFLSSGLVVRQEFIAERSRCDGLDQWRQMVRDEIDTNSDFYELSDEEKDLLIAKSRIVDYLAERMEMYMGRGDRNEYVALEMAFENDFPGMVESFREERVADALGFANFKVEDNAVFYGNYSEDEVMIFHDGDDNLYCKFGGEDVVRPLRDKIQDIQEGDAFLWKNEGYICIAAADAHQNFDEPDECWVVHDRAGEGYFEEDIGTDLGEKIRNLMKDLNPYQFQVHSLADKILAGEKGRRERAASTEKSEKDFER